MSDLYYGLKLDSKPGQHETTIHTLSESGCILGIAYEHPDGTANVSIVDGHRSIGAPGAFLHIDDALMAIKTYHDIRREIDKT